MFYGVQSTVVANGYRRGQGRTGTPGYLLYEGATRKRGPLAWEGGLSSDKLFAEAPEFLVTSQLRPV